MYTISELPTSRSIGMMAMACPVKKFFLVLTATNNFFYHINYRDNGFVRKV